MNIAIQNVLNGLRNGNMTSAYEYKGYLNDVAMTLYNKPQLTAEDIEDLKGIITICNITYNDTDKELLPIEDGFYDLLLEKYKNWFKYNWQNYFIMAAHLFLDFLFLLLILLTIG